MRATGWIWAVISGTEEQVRFYASKKEAEAAVEQSDVIAQITGPIEVSAEVTA